MKRAFLVLFAVSAAIGALSHSRVRAETPATPTFAKDVAPIVYDKCTFCHRPGQIGPMPFTTYAETRPWARLIKKKVVAREMPPWGADPTISKKFKNDRSLSAEQVEIIAKWVDTGAPMGDGKDLPPVPKFPDETWVFGPPDAVLEIPEFHLPAEGEIVAPDFVFPNPFGKDVWLAGNQVLPGNPRVVHHATPDVVRLPPGAVIKEDHRAYAPDGRVLRRGDFTYYGAVGEEGDRAGRDREASKLGSYLPGRGYEWYPEGTGRRLPKDAYLVFNLHYQASGQPETDRSKIGLYLTKGPIRREFRNASSFSNGVTMVNGKALARGERMPNIPPHADNFEVSGYMVFNRPATIHVLSPHMHLRGKSMKYAVIYPDGREEILLDVPKFDFNWQMIYELETPVKLPPGSKLMAVSRYDNSARNPYNPSPDKEVYWSEQSWDEMFSPQFRYVYDDVDLTKTLQP